jgi:hypothetical protein
MPSGGESEAYKVWHRLSDERNRYLDDVGDELAQAVIANQLKSAKG